MSLTFEQFTEVNVARAKRWHPGFPEDSAWTGADWSNALCGEAGELANVVKKLRRLEVGVDAGPDDGTREALLAQLADEIADVYTYLDLLAVYYDVDLVDALVRKFNRVSERQGMPERIEAP